MEICKCCKCVSIVLVRDTSQHWKTLMYALNYFMTCSKHFYSSTFSFITIAHSPSRSTSTQSKLPSISHRRVLVSRHVPNAIVMFDRALGPKLENGIPIVSRVRKSHTVPASASHQALHFYKEELVYELSAPKKGWVLIKKMDRASSIVVWVPKIYLTEPETGPYRARHLLVEHDGGQILKGEILQITRT